MKILGLIPARGGSKGIPRKNIKMLAGKPLISYTINQALLSKRLSNVMVSTEDLEIAETAIKLGAEVPFMRPEEMATDHSPTIDTITFVLQKYKEIGEYYDAVCLLQPTSPLRTKTDIDLAIEKFISTESDSLISVLKLPTHFNPHWAFEKQNDSNYLKLATGEKTIISRRQDLPTAYYRNGAIYITKTEVIFTQQSLYGNRIGYYLMDESQNLNLDTMEDWAIAERIFNKR